MFEDFYMLGSGADFLDDLSQSHKQETSPLTRAHPFWRDTGDSQQQGLNIQDPSRRVLGASSTGNSATQGNFKIQPRLIM